MAGQPGYLQHSEGNNTHTHTLTGANQSGETPNAHSEAAHEEPPYDEDDLIDVFDHGGGLD